MGPNDRRNRDPSDRCIASATPTLAADALATTEWAPADGSPIAIIVGGASGIGASTAELFVEAGWHIVIADLNVMAGEALGIRLGAATFVRTDAADEQAIKSLVANVIQAHGRLDCFIHSAGLVGATGTILELEAADWRTTLSVLLDSVFYSVKHAGRAMVQQRQGSILIVASIAGVVGGVGPHAYTAAKHGAVGLVKTAASEFAASGVRVNAVAPGTVVTPMIEQLRGSHQAALEGSAGTTAIGRPIMPADVADALLFLARAVNITGQVLVIDGGRLVASTSSAGASFHDRPAAFTPSTHSVRTGS